MALTEKIQNRRYLQLLKLLAAMIFPVINAEVFLSYVLIG